MPDRFVLAILAAALSLPAMAQSRGGGMGTGGFGISSGSPGGPRGGFVGGTGRIHQGHGAGRGSVLLPYPYVYPDSDYYAGQPTQQQPQIVVVPAAAPAPPPEPPAPRESLLIEWQGDHFVRTTLSSKNSTSVEQAGPDYSERSASRLASRQTATKQKKADQPVAELPPAVLVFHDGRREEVSEYSIISGTIYSKADYWTTGSWTKKIQIADLDVPATLKINQERGLKFVLPTSPNQIVIRP